MPSMQQPDVDSRIICGRRYLGSNSQRYGIPRYDREFVARGGVFGTYGTRQTQAVPPHRPPWQGWARGWQVGSSQHQGQQNGDVTTAFEHTSSSPSRARESPHLQCRGSKALKGCRGRVSTAYRDANSLAGPQAVTARAGSAVPCVGGIREAREAREVEEGPRGCGRRRVAKMPSIIR